MLLLLTSLSVLGLFAGAALVAMGRLRAGATSALDGLALGMLPTLVLARLLPHAYESLGFGALALATVGFGLVSVSHQAGERAEARLGSALALPALLAHAVADGAALAMSNTGRLGAGASLLAVAAIVHRIPEGFFVATRRPGRGTRAALYAAAPLALATIAGAALGQRIFDLLPDAGLDCVLALGSGAMLRLVSHSHEPAPAPQPRTARAIGAATMLCGCALVIAVPGPHDVLRRAQPQEFSVAGSLLPLFIESAPAMLVGLVLAAALRAHTRHPRTIKATGVVSEPLHGWVRGLAQQIRPGELARESSQLRSRGASTARIVGLCVASVQLDMVATALSFAWLGAEVSLLRILGSAVFALLLGAACWRIERPSQDTPPAATPPAEAEATVEHLPRSPRLWKLAQQALDEQGAWLLLGLLLSAACEAMLTPQWLLRVPELWANLLVCLLALPGYPSVLAATPLVAVLLHKGLALSAGLNFLWLSPLASVPRSVWLGRRPRTAALVGCTVATFAISSALGALAQRLLTAQAAPELHRLVTHEHTRWEYACAWLLAALWLRSLLRLGPRAFAQTIATTQPDLHHGHQHHPHTADRVNEPGALYQ